MHKVLNVHPELLAKTYTDSNGNKVAGVSVFVHCLIVGIVCREFVKYLPKKFVDKFNIGDFPIWCARHDLGKVGPGFQYRLDCVLRGVQEDESISGKYVMRHEKVSAAYLRSKYSDLHEMAECVIGMIEWHHGGDRTERHDDGRAKFCWDDDDHFSYGDGEWDIFRDEVDSALVSVFGSGESFVGTWHKLRKGNQHNSVFDGEVKYMMGLLSVCDWIGSDDEVAFSVSDYMGSEIDIDLISECANQAIRSFGLAFGEIESDLSFRDLFGFDSYSLQKTFPLMIDSYGLYIVEAPMGYGKTEAALAGAYQAMSKGLVRGVYFALPTQMTSNSMFNRYREFVHRISNVSGGDIRLVHGKAVYSNSDNSGMRSWFHGNKRGTISQFGLGTVDQALMGVIASMRHFYLRSFGLANKAVIIDEVHSYDVYTGALVRELINELIELDCVVIVLSATLTAVNRGYLSGSVDYIDKYPLITKVVGDDVTYKMSKEEIKSRSYRIRMEMLPMRGDFLDGRMQTLQEALDRVNRGELVLWIENTVRDSQAIYDWFIRYVSDVGLLNSWFSNKDRELNEAKWVSLYGKGGKRDRGMILVSTQVCEQSIDIDADFLVTALCPTDMLLQRIGREHRHHGVFKRSYEPECVILCPSALDSYETDSRGNGLIWEYRGVVGSSAWVYSPYVLKRTYATWKDFQRVELPKDIRKLLERTYDETYVGDAIDIDLKRYDADQSRLARLDASNTLSGGLGNRDDSGDLALLDDAERTTTHGTRRITIPTTEVYLVDSINGNEVVTMYGETVSIASKLNMGGKVALNDCGIKVRNTHIDRFGNVFIRRTIGRNEYIFCVVKDGVFRDISGREVPNLQYNSSNGLVIRLDG